MRVPLSDIESSEFAFCKLPALTACGTRAVDAGVKKPAPAPAADWRTASCQTWAVPSRSSTAVAASVAKRRRSAETITARRGSRSAQTPPTIVEMPSATVRAPSTAPRPSAPPWIPITANASATGMRESPTDDPVRANQRSLNGRSFSGPKRPTPLTSWERMP